MTRDSREAGCVYIFAVRVGASVSDDGVSVVNLNFYHAMYLNTVSGTPCV